MGGFLRSEDGPLRPALTVQFGAASTRSVESRVELQLPWLAGAASEVVPPVGGDFHIGSEVVALGSGPEALEEATLQVYRKLLQQGPGQVCRVWNYVPQINAVVDGLENYRRFCRARSRAFEEAWGLNFERALPAASAVGGPDGFLVVVYVIAPGAPQPVENPQQVPAYAYPPEHGPRSPSFCRAMCWSGTAHDWVFVSGTAAIKGHETMHPDCVEPQIGVTLDNLRLISEACSLGEDLGVAAGWQRHFKIYLRRESDLAAAEPLLAEGLLRPRDTAVWLRSDICRADLAIEIEATLWRPNVGAARP